MVRQSDDQQKHVGQRSRRRRLRDELKSIIKAVTLVARVVVAIAALARWLDH